MNVLDRTTRLARLFREAGTAHHHAFAATNGKDPDWPVWYAAFLSPRLDEVGISLSAERLAAALVTVDRTYRDAGSVLDWPEYYAEWFMQMFARGALRRAVL